MYGHVAFVCLDEAAVLWGIIGRWSIGFSVAVLDLWAVVLSVFLSISISPAGLPRG
jgi:hypothetical protein